MIELIRKWVQKFEEVGSTINQLRSGQPSTSRDRENVELVRASICENPRLSTRSSALGVPRSSLIRILDKDLHLNPYKIHMI